MHWSLVVVFFLLIAPGQQNVTPAKNMHMSSPGQGTGSSLGAGVIFWTQTHPWILGPGLCVACLRLTSYLKMSSRLLSESSQRVRASIQYYELSVLCFRNGLLTCLPGFSFSKGQLPRHYCHLHSPKAEPSICHSLAQNVTVSTLFIG